MGSIIAKAIVSAIPVLLPAIFEGLATYLRNIQNNPEALRAFYDIVRMFVKAVDELPKRSEGVTNAIDYLEDEFKKAKEQEHSKSGA